MSGKKWCFTLNNWNDDEQQRIISVQNDPTFIYLVFGRESGDSGTPHLQGYVCFSHSLTRSQVKTKLGVHRAHLEVARGSPVQASAYCKKDNDFEEFGELPSQGKRTDWDRYREFVQELGRIPTPRELVSHNVGLYARYKKGLLDIAVQILPPPKFTESQPRLGFQTSICGKIAADNHHPRKVDFVVDEVGNSGKSWITQWALSNYADKVQILGCGKRDDIAYQIDATKSVFLFDVPRAQMEYFQYPVIEMLKNRLVQSNKYEACLKQLPLVPYVAVFSNEMPDMEKMSEDRYNIIVVNEENRGH